MCGRYAVGGNVRSAFRTWGLNLPSGFSETYNATPGSYLPVVLRESPLKSELMKWGLIPFWRKEPRVKFSTINARAETVNVSATFRNAFRKHRCLVPAEAFYEWKRLIDGRKIPFGIKLRTRPFFAFAGIWDEWKDAEGKILRSYAIITCEPNSVMAKIHNRMPVILKPKDEETWVNPTTPIDLLLQLLKPYDDTDIIANKISTKVNNPDNDSRDILEPSE